MIILLGCIYVGGFYNKYTSFKQNSMTIEQTEQILREDNYKEILSEEYKTEFGIA